MKISAQNKKLLNQMGFKEISSDLYCNSEMGYISFKQGTKVNAATIAHKIFELGKDKKSEEVKRILNIQ